MNIMQYASSHKNPPKGYGSIDRGIEVARYRRERKAYWTAQGFDYIESVTKAQQETVSKFGAAV